MCTLCGCSSDLHIPGTRDHHSDAGHGHSHDHLHARSHQPEGSGGRALAPARIRIERDLLADNERFAVANQDFLAHQGAVALNLLSSPGAGKTTLLERTVADLRKRMPLAVIEGDQETSFDADRVSAAGVRAIQINTGKMCHLDAHMVGHALADLDPEPGAVVFIENIGNLVCPAAFNLGEARKVVLLSVTEGDDKPRKYRDMFAVADLVLITKIDLLAYVRFDLGRCRDFARSVNPRVQIRAVSAVKGTGLAAWYAWIEGIRPARPARVPARVSALV